MKKGARKVVIISNLIVILLSLSLFAFNSLDVMTNAFFDFNVRSTMSHQPHEDILIIEIDENTLNELGSYPFDRKYYADLIRNLEKGNPKVIAFDIMFHQPGERPESDQIVAEELAKHDNIIFPVTAYMESAFSSTTTVQRDSLLMAQSLSKSIPLFDEWTERAHINANFDKDTVIRRTWLQLNTPEDGIVPSLAYKTAEMAGADVAHFLNYNPQTEIIIDYEAVTHDFETIPFYRVVGDEIPTSTYEDRIILVGYTTPGQDQGATPIEKRLSLVYAHANIVNQLMHDTNIELVNRWIIFAGMLLLVLLIGLFTWKMKSTLYSILVVSGIIIALLLIPYYVYSGKRLFIDPIYLLTASLLAYIANIAIKSYFETKQKNFITKQFGRYISPDLVKEIAKSDQEMQLGGINKELSILFLDIRGFTTLSEKLKPEEVVDFLNTMFNLITHVALDNKGTIDKFIGDAAMIIFNAPLDLTDHEYYAVKTAYDIQKGMVEVHEQIFEKYEVEVSVGIGVNTGIVVVGNIGSYLRVDYTAIGDNVNTAARIESNTKANQVLVSEETYNRTKDYFDYEFDSEKLMKGKTIPLKLYEVKGHVAPPA